MPVQQEREPAPVHPDVERVLLTSDQIQTRLREMAVLIDRDYADRQVLLVGVLKGAFLLMADLARYVTVPVHFDFMAVSSYGSATQTSGVVRILKDLEQDIDRRHVLLVEDIVDTGLTLNYLLRSLRARGPASLDVLSLLTKPEQVQVPIDVRYVGFEVPGVFVVGYGLDYAERYRNLPYIGTLRRRVYETP
ncbi:hypoxanthine phosphoribosyltransferase [soil metagenome]